MKSNVVMRLTTLTLGLICLLTVSVFGASNGSQLDEKAYAEKYPKVNFVIDLKLDQIIEKDMSATDPVIIKNDWIILGTSDYDERDDAALSIWNKTGSIIPTVNFQIRSFKGKGVMNVLNDTIQRLAPTSKDASEIYAQVKKIADKGIPQELYGRLNTVSYTCKSGYKYKITIDRDFPILELPVDRWRFVAKDPAKRRPVPLYNEPLLFDALQADHQVTVRANADGFVVLDTDHKGFLSVNLNDDLHMDINATNIDTQKEALVLAKILDYYSLSVYDSNKILAMFLRSYLTWDVNPKSLKIKTPVDFRDNGMGLVWDTSILMAQNLPKSVKVPTEEEVADRMHNITSYLQNRKDFETVKAVEKKKFDLTKNTALVKNMKQLIAQSPFQTREGLGAYTITPTSVALYGFTYHIYEVKDGMILAANSSWHNEIDLRTTSSLLTALTGSKTSADEIFDKVVNYRYGYEENQPEGFTTSTGTNYRIIDLSSAKVGQCYIYILIENYKQ